MIVLYTIICLLAIAVQQASAFDIASVLGEGGLTALIATAGFAVGGIVIGKFIVPFYAKHVDNRKIYAIVFKATQKADEYSSGKFGKANIDALQNTMLMTFAASFVASADGSGVDPQVAFNEALKLRPSVPGNSEMGIPG